MIARSLLTLIAACVLTGCAGSASTRTSKGAEGLSLLVMPVRGIMPHVLTPNFGAARDGGARAHEGLDIMAPEGREVLAIASGKIDTKKWNDLGGNTLWLLGDDGMFYYYAHLHSYRDGISAGTRVRAGEVLGFVGKTGNATTPHLHFEIHRSRKGAALDPFTILAVDDILVLPLPIDSMKKPTVTAPKRKK